MTVSFPPDPTLAELEIALDERQAVAQLHKSLDKWTVILYAAEDPAAACYVTHHNTIARAMRAALDAWDKGEP